MQLLLQCCLSAVSILLASAGLNRDDTQEKRLVDSLFSGYDAKLRPPGTVQVKFALNLNQIVQLLEKDQIIVVNAFVDHIWYDERLSWNPLEYGDLSAVRLSGEYFWRPDTMVYTTADGSGFLYPQQGANFVLRYDGQVFWPNPLSHLRSRCSMSIDWFPFDSQLCTIIFGSWSYTSSYINYTLMAEDQGTGGYTPNNEWVLVACKGVRSETKYETWIEDDSFSEISYQIRIRRKPLFVIQNCVVPAIMLCILTLVSFFIPFPQAMQLGISIMLAFSVFKLRLSDDVPVQADTVPLINVYFLVCMAFSLTAMIWFSITNSFRTQQSLPAPLRSVMLKVLCKGCCPHSLEHKQASLKIERQSSSRIIMSALSSSKGKTSAVRLEHSLCANFDQKSPKFPNQHLQAREFAQARTSHQIVVASSSSDEELNDLRRTDYVDLPICRTDSFVDNQENYDNLNSLNRAFTNIQADNNNNNKKNKELKSKRQSELRRSLSNADSVKSAKHNDERLIQILNKFVFYIFLLFIITLNMFSLVIFPIYVRHHS